MTALAGQTVAGVRVFDTKVTEWRENQLPGVAVYTLHDAVDPESARSSAPRELKRTLQLKLEGAVQLADGVAAALDALSEELERVVDRDPTFGGVASDSILSNTDVVIDRQAAQPVGSIVLTYEVTYYTDAPKAADTPLVDFARADIRTSLGGAVHPDNQAEDLVEIPTT